MSFTDNDELTPAEYREAVAAGAFVGKDIALWLICSANTGRYAFCHVVAPYLSVYYDDLPAAQAWLQTMRHFGDGRWVIRLTAAGRSPHNATVVLRCRRRTPP